MRALLIGLIVAVMSFGVSAHNRHHHHHKHHHHCHANDLKNCHIKHPVLRHKPGYYFVKVDGRYYPAYQHPRFNDYDARYGKRYGRDIYGFYGYGYRKACLCHDRPVRNRTGIHGMFRCYNREGLSQEYYLR